MTKVSRVLADLPIIIALLPLIRNWFLGKGEAL